MSSAQTGLLLTPGASAGPDQSSLVAIDQAVSAHGIKVRRYGIGRGGNAERLVSRVSDEARRFCEAEDIPADCLFLGGRSLGGRVCSMAVANGLPAAGLVLVSYPLHPPGRPEQLRDGHFPEIKVPCLFISGGRDAFATPEELESATQRVAGDVTHIWVDGGDHGLRSKDGEVSKAVAFWISRLAA